MQSSPVTLAIVANAPSPYRIHQHRRVATELAGQVVLHSVFLHEHNWQPWNHELPREIQPICFGPGEQVGSKASPLAWRRDWNKMGRVIEWLQLNQVDAVITTGYSSPGLLRLIGWCWRRGVPNFLFGDSNIYAESRSRAKRLVKSLYVNWAVQRVTGLLPCGDYGRQYFALYGGGEKPCFYMPHEPDYAGIFATTPERREKTQAKYNLGPERRYFLYSGRLAPVKRVDTLLDAFIQIAAERPDWDLLIVGGGPLEASLKARVPESLSDRVRWTGFIGDPAELAAVYACADAFVIPSSYEPWAVVVCEAAAAGLPILASEVVGAAGELCRNGVNGWLFPVGDVEKLADAMRTLTSDDALLQQFSKASLQVLDDWRRRGDPVQGVRLALAHVGLLPPPPPVKPSPPTPTARPGFVAGPVSPASN